MDLKEEASRAKVTIWCEGTCMRLRKPVVILFQNWRRPTLDTKKGCNKYVGSTWVKDQTDVSLKKTEHV